MKKKWWIKYVTLICLSLFLCACNKNKEAEVLEDLNTYNDEIEMIDIEKSYTVDIDLTQMDSYLMVYAYQAEQTAHYSTKIEADGDVKGMKIVYNVLDDNSNSLLEITNKNLSKEKSFDLIAGKTYYISWHATKESDGSSCSFKITTSKVDDSIDSDEIKDELKKEVDTSSYLTAYINPEKSGYYNISIDANVDSEMGATIYSILKDGNDEVYTSQGICWLDEGSTYYIVYGYEAFEDSKVDVIIKCVPVDILEVEEDLKISTDSIIHYYADKDGQILVYTVSKGDPQAEVYDDAYKVVAQNNDGDGMFSENKKDLALLINVQKGKDYYVYISYVDEGECEVYFEDYNE